MIEWFNENENRAYPVDDNTYLVDDAGKLMPFSLIADIGVSVPEGTGDVFITGVYSGPAMVSVAVGTLTRGLLVGTAVKTALDSYAPLYMTPINDDVSGYVVFGTGAQSHTGNYRFSAGQMKLDFRTVRTFHGAQVTTVNRLGASDDSKLSGMVNIEVSGAMQVRRIDEHTAAFSLKEGTEVDFLGPCDRVAEFNKCGPPPIRSINGAVPDQDGVIIIRTS